MTDAQVRSELRRQVAALGTQTALARRMGCSLPYLNDVLAGKRAPGPKILRALGLKKTTAYLLISP